MKLRVLHEDNHLLVVDKPAGLLTQPDFSKELSLVDIAKRYRALAEEKKGGVYIGLVHRLDREVGGVVVLAKTSKSAARLSEQFRRHEIVKIYWAVVDMSSCRHRLASGQQFTWEDRLTCQSEGSRSVRSQEAQTTGRVVRCVKDLALLELRPQSGRKHQLRIQASRRNMPIVGDTAYGSRRNFEAGIALHAAGLQLTHPTTRATLFFESRPPATWRRFPFGPADYRLQEGRS